MNFRSSLRHALKAIKLTELIIRSSPLGQGERAYKAHARYYVLIDTLPSL
jgi:hypothetical protein